MACPSLLSDDDLRRFRTKTCQRGGCEFGVDRCQYSHCTSWVRRCPFYLAHAACLRYVPLLCPQVELRASSEHGWETVGSVVANRCERGGYCPFSHSQEELSYHPLVYKTQPCPNFAAGTCRAYYCPKVHGTAETRSLDNKVFYLPFVSQEWQPTVAQAFPQIIFTAAIPKVNGNANGNGNGNGNNYSGNNNNNSGGSYNNNSGSHNSGSINSGSINNNSHSNSNRSPANLIARPHTPCVNNDDGPSGRHNNSNSHGHHLHLNNHHTSHQQQHNQPHYQPHSSSSSSALSVPGCKPPAAGATTTSSACSSSSSSSSSARAAAAARFALLPFEDPPSSRKSAGYLRSPQQQQQSSIPDFPCCSSPSKDAFVDGGAGGGVLQHGGYTTSNNNGNNLLLASSSPSLWSEDNLPLGAASLSTLLQPPVIDDFPSALSSPSCWSTALTVTDAAGTQQRRIIPSALAVAGRLRTVADKLLLGAAGLRDLVVLRDIEVQALHLCAQLDRLLLLKQ